MRWPREEKMRLVLTVCESRGGGAVWPVLTQRVDAMRPAR
jgi:hypothetical protein